MDWEWTRLFEDAPLLALLWATAIRPLVRDIRATDAKLLRRQATLNRNQRKLGAHIGVELEETGSFPPVTEPPK